MNGSLSKGILAKFKQNFEGESEKSWISVLTEKWNVLCVCSDCIKMFLLIINKLPLSLQLNYTMENTLQKYFPHGKCRILFSGLMEVILCQLLTHLPTWAIVVWLAIVVNYTWKRKLRWQIICIWLCVSEALQKLFNTCIYVILLGNGQKSLYEGKILL